MRGPHGPLSEQYRTVTIANVALVSLVAFEALAVSTAMPVVARELEGLRAYGLAFSLFLTMSMLGMVVAGGWCDAKGPRWPIVSGLALFAGGLVASGAAQTFPQMLVGRVISGAGGGFLVVSLYVVIAAVYPESLRPRVFGWISAAWVVPSVVGPALAGWLATEVSWRWVFLAVPPLVLLVSVGLLPRVRGLAAAPEVAEASGAAGRGLSSRRRVLIGLGLAVGVTVLQWGSQQLDPPTTWSAAALVCGAAGVLLFLPPLLPRGTLRAGRGLPAVIAVRGLLAACFFGAETFVPLMLVNERGLTPTVAGVTLTGGAVGWAVGSWLQARPGFARERHLLLSSGAGIVTLAVAVLPLGVLAGVPPTIVLPFWLCAGFGMGLAYSSTSVLVLALSPTGEEGRNSASLQVSDALGSVVGIGAAGALFAALHTRPGDDGHVFALIWATLAVVGVLAAVVGYRGRRPASLATP